MEVYGTKPKLFTKEWWPYFWEYYKVQTVLSVLAALALIYTISECKNQKNYDLQIDVITENKILQSSLDTLLDITEENVSDVTENGKTEVFINYMDMDANADAQFVEAMVTKVAIEAGYTEAFVFIVSKKYADYMSNIGVFKSASDWTDAESYDGYCISLENCSILQDIGIDTSDLYVGIVELRERDKETVREKNRPKQENGIEFARFLLNER